MDIKSSPVDNILKALEDIYLLALEKENFTVALKAKELLGRACGLFDLKNQGKHKTKIDLEHLSDEDINHLSEALATKLKLDPGGGAE